jgi:hypothetical protein
MTDKGMGSSRKITGANAGGRWQVRIRGQRAARIVQFWR